MSEEKPFRLGNSSWFWLALHAVVVLAFFFEHVFLGRSLLPLDLLNQMLLPRAAGAPLEIQTHYGIDQITQLWPNLIFWRDSVLRGEFPLWNPHFLGGHAHHGATGWTMLGIFKIPLLLPITVERAYTGTAVFQFWLAGVFLFSLLRELRHSRQASFIGACSWSLCSNFLMFHWIFLNVFVWVPLLLLCWERTWRFQSWSWGFATSVVMALAFLGGSVQMVAFVGFLWGLWALGTVELGSIRAWLKASCWMCGVFAVAAFLCAAQWLPTAEFMRLETQRLQNLDPGAFGWKHTLLGPPMALVMMLAPALAGSPQTFDLLKLIQGSAIDFNAYIGVVPAILALLGALAPRDRRTRNLLLIIGMVLFLVFATPFQKFVYHRFLLLAVFAVVVLAARGFDQLRQGTIPASIRLRVFQAATIGGMLLLLGTGFASILIRRHATDLTALLERQVRPGAATNQFGTHLDWLLGRIPGFLEHYSPFNPEFWVPAVAVIAFGCVGWVGIRQNSAKTGALQFICLGAVIVDLSVTLRNRVSRVDLTQFPVAGIPRVLEPVRSDPDWFRVYRWIPGDRLTLMDNLGWAWGLNQLSGYESMSPDGLSRLHFGESNGFNRVLNLTSVKYLVTRSNFPHDTNRFEWVADQVDLKLLRNRDWLPPVRFARRPEVVPNIAAALARLADPTFNPLQSAVFIGDAPILPEKLEDILPRESWVRIHDRSARGLSAEVSATEAGYVIFSETMYPGWKATVDGVEMPVHRVDAYLQAVVVRKGLHQVEFRFDPDSFRFGWKISVATLAMGSLILSVRMIRIAKNSCSPSSV